MKRRKKLLFLAGAGCLVILAAVWYFASFRSDPQRPFADLDPAADQISIEIKGGYRQLDPSEAQAVADLLSSITIYTGRSHNSVLEGDGSVNAMFYLTDDAGAPITVAAIDMGDKGYLSVLQLNDEWETDLEITHKAAYLCTADSLEAVQQLEDLYHQLPGAVGCG